MIGFGWEAWLAAVLPHAVGPNLEPYLAAQLDADVSPTGSHACQARRRSGG